MAALKVKMTNQNGRAKDKHRDQKLVEIIQGSCLTLVLKRAQMNRAVSAAEPWAMKRLKEGHMNEVIALDRLQRTKTKKASVFSHPRLEVAPLPTEHSQ